MFVRGVNDYGDVYYSVDSAEGRDSLSLRDIGRGQHTLSEQTNCGGWLDWLVSALRVHVTGAAPLEIPALCNGAWADYDTSDACFAADSGGILAEDSPVIWTLGVSEWANLLYSIDEGPAIAREDFTLRNLAAGFHTIRVSEQQAAGWTGWSEPYAFTITGAAPVEITAICSRGGPETSDACRVAGAGGILAETSPSIWRRGTVNTANDRYSIDGGEAITWEDFTLRNLASGRHHVRLGEQQPAGWTGWTEPYWFTITGAAPIEITAICNRNGHATSDECRAAGASGILAERDPSIWRRGTVSAENVQYSVDGGPAVTREDFTLRTLAPGPHQVRLSEQQPAGWTGWSEPYWFTITGAAPIEILAYCDGTSRGHDSWEECHAATVTRGGRHWIWPSGRVDYDNLRVSIDGGSAVAWNDLSLIALRDGRHNIRIAEQQTAGWTGWSEPYWFTIRE